MSERRPVSTRRPVPDHMFSGRLRGSYLLDLEVVGVDEVAPHVRLITMASSDLVGFEYTPGQDLMFEFPDGDRALRRRYTIRRSDPAEGTADFEIEIHDGRGPATRWAAKAELGEHLEAIGPRGGISLRPTATSHLLVADDSAMPAAFVLLEALCPSEATTRTFFLSVRWFGSRREAIEGRSPSRRGEIPHASPGEMLRAQVVDHRTVTAAAAEHGYSRAEFYLVAAAFEEHGMAGLLDERRGRKGPVKLTAPVREFLDSLGPCSASDAAAALEARLGVRLHPRSIQRVRRG